MRVKFKSSAVEYLNYSFTNQFRLNKEDKDNLSSFINSKPTFIEIGPGKGNFILSLAKKFPEYNFIVIELNLTIAGICLKKIDESNLDNVKLVAEDFYKFVDIIQSKSIEGIFLNFSDPWPKSRHEKRRLTYDRFLLNYSYILKDNGKLYLKSDNLNFFNYSLSQFKKMLWNIEKINNDYKEIEQFDALTEYENKFRNESVKINRVVLSKNKDTKVKEVINMNYGVYYNYKEIGDILIISFKPHIKPSKIEKRGRVVILKDNNDELVGYNILDIKDIIKIKINGLIPLLNNHILNIINNILIEEGLDTLPIKKESGFKVCIVKEVNKHPLSDHLHLCKVDCGDEELIDIVCGAYNVREGLRCVLATVNTFMPNGEIIQDSELLNEKSHGMLCSGRELNLEGYENKSGLLELDDTYVIGSDFFKLL